MTTRNDINGQEEKLTVLYGRLSDDDGVDLESNSITNQRTILQDYARSHGYPNTRFFFDDGVSGTTFDRPGFREMESLAEAGKVSTIIVKDLSRFGRNYLEVGKYLEVVYPTLGIKFIAIQENVDTMNGTGTEMMPFHNIFNEWYAAQTSKKIRAVWAMKAANGKRIGSSVPYGYRKDPEDHEKWLIDPEAAEVVREIYALCIAGRGPSQIARDLDAKQVPTPTAHFQNMGFPVSNPAPAQLCRWSDRSVDRILSNRQYTGCTVNFKTTTVSYKVQKTVYKPREEWQIIPNTQEAIIDETTWLRVQELRKNKRRPTKTGKKSLFSGLVFCPDCGAKLHFCAAKSLRRDQEFFRCANYKEGRGKCRIHYIRDIVLQKIVTEAVGDLSDFVRCYEPVFLYMLERKEIVSRKQEQQAAEANLETWRRRSREIDRIISRLYEDNTAGKITDERFSRLMLGYETEQRDLEKKIAENEEKLCDLVKAAVDLRALLEGFRKFTELKELTPEVVNTLIKRIEVHNSDRHDGHCHVKVDIYFTAVGMIDRPSEEEIREMTAQMQNGNSLVKETA